MREGRKYGMWKQSQKFGGPFIGRYAVRLFSTSGEYRDFQFLSKEARAAFLRKAMKKKNYAGHWWHD